MLKIEAHLEKSKKQNLNFTTLKKKLKKTLNKIVKETLKHV